MSLGGLYPAKVVDATTHSKPRVLIPQVFADIPVPLYDLTGGAPSNGERGYVSFINGEAEYPVWVSSSAAAALSDGPSEPVSSVVEGPRGPKGDPGPRGGPGEPGAPGTFELLPGGDTGQALIKASATDGDVAWGRPWGVAWGFLGKVSNTSDQSVTALTSMGPGQSITGLSIPAGRRHRISFRCRHSSSAGHAVQVQIDAGTTATPLTAGTGAFLPHVRVTQSAYLAWDIEGFTGSQVRATFDVTSGTGRIRGDVEPTVLMIEDLGPL